MSYDEEMTGQTAHLYYEQDLDPDRELENLRSLLQKTQEKLIGQWLGTNFNRQRQENKNRHQMNLVKLTDKVGSLNNDLAALRQRKDTSEKERCQQAHEMEAGRRQLDDIHEETDKILLEKERKERRVKNLKDEILKQKNVVQSKTVSTEECCRELEQDIQFFSTRLGLRLKKVSGERLQIVYTNIDDKEPSRPFCLCVRINPDRTYTISDVQPQVPDLEDLTDKLQATNDFRSFVINMRQKFQSLVS